MRRLRGFLEIKRKDAEQRPVCRRVKDYKEVLIQRDDALSKEQASRCMDCGTPFCHWGCPLGSYIPEWNDFMFNDNWEMAFKLLDATNNLPEITGRVCPALCEYACVLGINDDSITVKDNELAIIEYAFRHRIIKPNPPKKRTQKRIAIIGSGPAGLSCGQWLNRRGHNVVIFERDDKVGGILRYGIPDFKLEKWVIDRRVDIIKKEGVKFQTGVDVGIDLPIKILVKEFDAVCLTGGSRVPRDLKIEGRELKGIYFAMDYLSQSNRRVAGEDIPKQKLIDARDKNVVVLGGGDTGADCVGTACRQGAKSVTQIEVLPKPPKERTPDMRWPAYPQILKISSSHEEGCQRYWSVMTKRFIGENGRVKGLSCVQHGKDFEIPADLVILAIGFLHPERGGLLRELEIKLDKKGNVKTDENYMTSVRGIFSAGDMRRGQSLVVWAIHEGRECAEKIDEHLRV